MTELIEKVCPVCGIVYGLERSFYEYRHRGSASEDEKRWYCPNGHSLIVTKSVAAKLTEELEQERRRREHAEQRVAERADEAQVAWRTASAYKGQVTRLRNRAKAGVCPCCNRSFENLRRHMESKHPTFTPMTDLGPLQVIDGGKAVA